jgi:DNA polymerase-3 subunit epsilon
MATLFFDTACGAFALKGTDWKPHCVRLAAIVEHDGEIIDSVSMLVRPEPGWAIEASAAPYHKATKHDFAAEGVSIIVLAHTMETLLKDATRIVCYNSPFHTRLLKHIFIDAGIPVPSLPPITCAMVEATPIMKLVSMRFGTWKSPKLTEAYKYFTGTEMPVMETWEPFGRMQVQAARDVYNAIQARKAKKPDPGAVSVARTDLGF